MRERKERIGGRGRGAWAESLHPPCLQLQPTTDPIYTSVAWRRL